MQERDGTVRCGVSFLPLQSSNTLLPVTLLLWGALETRARPSSCQSSFTSARSQRRCQWLRPLHLGPSLVLAVAWPWTRSHVARRRAASGVRAALDQQAAMTRCGPLQGYAGTTGHNTRAQHQIVLYGSTCVVVHAPHPVWGGGGYSEYFTAERYSLLLCA